MKKENTPIKPRAKRTTRPALDPDARENELISLASNLAEEQLRNGTASSQVITHYLKLGTAKARLEKKLLEKQIDLAEAKTNAYKASEQTQASVQEAINAMKSYQGSSEVYFDDQDLQ